MMFLTDTEVAELTGLTRQSAQCHWLERHGIRHLVNAEGKPRVLRSHLERIMGGPAQKAKTQPNFDALKAS